MLLWVGISLLSFVLAALLTYLVLSRRQALRMTAGELSLVTAQNELAIKDRDLERLVSELAQLRTERDHFETNYHAIVNAKTELETILKERERSFEERLVLIDEAQKKLSDAFQALSADALKNNAESFLTLAGQTFENLKSNASKELDERKTAVENLVKPLQESLVKVTEKMSDIEKSRIAGETQLGSQLKAISELQGRLQKETGTLANALKAPQVRGRWGEIQLKRVVELAGMVEYCDFETQVTIDGKEGSLRPDMVVKLPNHKNIVIDAKTTGLAYLESLEAADDASRLLKLKDHARQVRDQLIKLSSKAYWQGFDPAPEFVVLFLPVESFYSAALEQDPKLIELGADSKVLIATPTTLIALLRAVAFGWKQESLAQNAKEISDLGKQLYERILTGTGHVEDLKRNLERVIQSFNKFVGNFESRVLTSARRFSELGVGGESRLDILEPVDEIPRTLQLIKGESS